jgi:hypothetical protein
LKAAFVETETMPGTGLLNLPLEVSPNAYYSPYHPPQRSQPERRRS